MANLVVLIDVLLIVSLLMVSSPSSVCVEAAESYCRRDLQAVWCNLFRFYEASTANGPSNFPSTSNFNATQPWVITGNDHLVFNASSSSNSSLAIRPPAWPTFNLVAMFLFGNATLEIQDTAWSSAANIYVCDNATLRAVNTSYQNEALVKFQYSIWFAGTSRGEFRDTAINTASNAAPATMQSNVFFWVREKASFLVDNVWGSRGFFLDTMQVVVADDATSLQANTHMLEESYIAGTAATRFHNVSFTDLFFEVCPGEETLTLSHLPEVCDLAPGGAGELCFSATHKALNYSLSPPAAPYTVEMVDTKVFSWAASLYGNSSVVLKDNPPRANIGVGMGGLFTETPGETVTVSASIGEGTSYFRGVPNRNVTVDNTSVIAWHIWASDDKGDGQKLISNYSIETTSGSDIADVLTSGDITISLANTSLNNGHLISSKSSNPVFIRGGSVNYELRARDNGGYIAVSQDTALTKDASIIADDTSAVYLYDISSSPPLASKVSTLGSGTVRSLTLTEPAFAADAVMVLEVNGLVQISAVASQQGDGSSGGLYAGNYTFNIYNSGTHALVFTTELPTPNVTDGWVNATFGGTGDFILQVSLATDSHKEALGHGCRRIFKIVDSLSSSFSSFFSSTSSSTTSGRSSPEESQLPSVQGSDSLRSSRSGGDSFERSTTSDGSLFSKFMSSHEEEQHVSSDAELASPSGLSFALPSSSSFGKESSHVDSRQTVEGSSLSVDPSKDHQEMSNSDRAAVSSNSVSTRESSRSSSSGASSQEAPGGGGSSSTEVSETPPHHHVSSTSSSTTMMTTEEMMTTTATSTTTTTTASFTSTATTTTTSDPATTTSTVVLPTPQSTPSSTTTFSPDVTFNVQLLGTETVPQSQSEFAELMATKLSDSSSFTSSVSASQIRVLSYNAVTKSGSFTFIGNNAASLTSQAESLSPSQLGLLAFAAATQAPSSSTTSSSNGSSAGPSAVMIVVIIAFTVVVVSVVVYVCISKSDKNFGTGQREQGGGQGEDPFAETVNNKPLLGVPTSGNHRV